MVKSETLDQDESFLSWLATERAWRPKHTAMLEVSESALRELFYRAEGAVQEAESLRNSETR
jgi:hypothetical protein